MTNWDALLEELERRWNLSREEVCDNLVATIRYAVFSQLDFVRSATSLLRENAKSAQVQDWAGKYHKKCQKWLEDYWKLQERCMNVSNCSEHACKCILQGVVPLLANNFGERSQRVEMLDLIEKDKLKIAKTLLQTLSNIDRICDQLQTQDFSWLLTYIDEEDRLQ